MAIINKSTLCDNVDDGFIKNTLHKMQVWPAYPAISSPVVLGITGDDLFRDQCESAACDPSRTQSLYRQAHKQNVNTSYGLRRLREKLLGHTSDGASSEDVLTLLLCNALEEPEGRALAIYLLDTFGGLRAILAAKESSLSLACGGHEECVALIKGYYLLMKTALREPVENRPIMKDISVLYDYLRVSLAHEEDEVFRILFLNSKNILLKDELISRGTVNRVMVYPREVVKRVLNVGAQAVVLVHNHPSGDHRPSREDIEMTIRLNRVLTDIDVTLHDHIIVGRHGCESMRLLGLI